MLQALCRLPYLFCLITFAARCNSLHAHLIMMLKAKRKWLLLLVPMLVLAFCEAWAGGKPSVTTTSFPLFKQHVEPFTLDEPEGFVAQFELDETESARDWVQSRMERKKRSRFLVRSSEQNLYLRKGYSRVLQFFFEPVSDPDHEPAPDEIWHTKPRYYVFLFRLSPF